MMTTHHHPRDRPRTSCPRALCALICLALSCAFARASESHGQITFNTLPLPGAIVTATPVGGPLDKKFTTVSDQQGLYSFPDLPDGAWKIEVQMTLFATLAEEVTVSPTATGAKFELHLLPADQILAQATAPRIDPPALTPRPAPTVAANGKPEAPKSGASPEAPRPPEDTPRPSDGFLINGSTNNAATSQFSLAQAFGNQRATGKSLYTGGIALVFDNSAFDARQYSISGLSTPKPAYNHISGIFNIGGPINIPHWRFHGPNFFLGYQWTRDHNAITSQGLVPTAAERTGDLTAIGGGIVPVTPQAAALLAFYPLPNVAGNPRYNYQVPILNSSHQDQGQLRLDKAVTRKNVVYGSFAFQSTRASSANIFGFNDTTDTLGLNSAINWNHRFSQRLYTTLGYRFSRLRSSVIPQFDNRANISGAAGITGNDQDPADWGPPTLNFASGITSLTDAQSAFNRFNTNALSLNVSVYRGRHNISTGGDSRRQEFNYFTEANPRGTFTFTGAATASAANPAGSDLADFLTGTPDTSSIAFGNPDKYLRQSVYDGFLTDDWRVRPELTINAGVRWEYGAPITELFNRLVNLDGSANSVSSFSAVAPVLASQPKGSLTGTQFPTSLIRPTKNRFEPRIGISWRPIPGSTLVVRAGYGVYDDTSVYQATALALAQQYPLSKSLSVQRSAACPITLANGFNNCGTTTPDQFAVDPNFRVGYAQTWQLLVQRDLPGSLQATATYLGIKGTRGVQEFLPNTYPIGAANPCPTCPSGFIYRDSNGNSTRESIQVQLRRRLKNGFTASVQYTYSKSIDDDSVLGGQGPVAPGATSQASAGTTPSGTIAQNWLNLRAERGLSTFDQRNLLNATLQYTSGQGLGGGSLMEGWHGKLIKEWTFLTTITAGSGLPETPVYYATVPGTGITGPIRPNVTGANIYNVSGNGNGNAGLHLNPAAYTAPTLGQWGSAGRDSIIGPGQFTMTTSLSRTFRLHTRFNLDTRLDSTNLINHPVFTGWDTTINNAEYGLPLAANPMRSLQITTRLRF